MSGRTTPVTRQRQTNTFHGYLEQDSLRSGRTTPGTINLWENSVLVSGRITPGSSSRCSFLPRPITPTHMRSFSVSNRIARRGSVGSPIPLFRHSTPRSYSMTGINTRKHTSLSGSSEAPSLGSKIPVSLPFSRHSRASPTNNSVNNNSTWDSTSCLEVGIENGEKLDSPS